MTLSGRPERRRAREGALLSPTRMKIVDDVLLPSSILRIGHLNGGAVSEAWTDARSVRG